MTDFAPQNFSMKSGDSKTLEVTVRNANGVPIALAGTSVMTWRLARTARSTPALSKTIGAGITIIATNAAAGEANCGRCDIVISAVDSELLDGEYFHDCHMIDVAGAHITIFEGRANFTPNLT